MTAVGGQPRNSWLVPLRSCPSPRSRVVFFPFAGGGPSAFRSWTSAIPGPVELWAVQMPGRERRIHEAAHRNLRDVLEPLVPAVAEYVDRPTVFVGHSMGALIAFEVAHALRAAGHRPPDVLVLSASCAPDWPRQRRGLYNRSDAEVVQELLALNGTQPAILNNREMMDLMLPTFRADFELTDTYEYQPREPLPIPLVVAGGVDDANVPLPSLWEWRRHTGRSFALHELQGDHFFCLKSPAALQEIVERGLRVAIGRGQG